MAEMLVDGAKLDACLDAEADAIRAKTGGSADIPFDYANNKGFADAIAAIETGGGVTTQPLSVTENGTYTAPSGTAYTPVTVNVPTGGGGFEMKLLHETAPTTEQVSAIKVDFTQDMQGYDFYRVVLLGRFAKNPYPYVGFNTETNNRYLNTWTNTATGSSHWECFLVKAENKYFASLGANTSSITGNPSYFHVRSYSADGYFNTGFIVQIWGCNYENS